MQEKGKELLCMFVIRVIDIQPPVHILERDSHGCVFYTNFACTSVLLL